MRSASEARSTPTSRSASARSPSTRWRWPAPTRRSRTAAGGSTARSWATGRASSSASSGSARVASRRTSRRPTACWTTGEVGDDHGHPRGRRPVRHGPSRGDPRPQRRREDGDDRQLRRRLVRRLHAGARRRGLGRVPGPAAADAHRVRRRARHGRHPARSHLEGVREAGRGGRRPASFDCGAVPRLRPPTGSSERGGEWRARQRLLPGGERSSSTSPGTPRRPRPTASRTRSPVPLVVGMTADEAVAQLGGQPLGADIAYVPAKVGRLPGLVVNQEPRGGGLSANDTVQLWVSKAQHGQLPNFVGSSVADVNRELRRLQALRVQAVTAPGPQRHRPPPAPRAGRRGQAGADGPARGRGRLRNLDPPSDVAPGQVAGPRDADTRRGDDLDGSAARIVRNGGRSSGSPSCATGDARAPASGGRGREQRGLTSSRPRRARIRSMPCGRLERAQEDGRADALLRRRRRWRTSGSRTSGRRRGARAARTSSRCAGSGRGRSGWRDRRARTPPSRRSRRRRRRRGASRPRARARPRARPARRTSASRALRRAARPRPDAPWTPAADARGDRDRRGRPAPPPPRTRAARPGRAPRRGAPSRPASWPMS